MSILKLIIHPNIKLRKKSLKVNKYNNKLKKNILDMIDTMNYYKGIGISAPQVDIKKSIAIVKQNNKQLILINPKIIEKKKIIFYKEGCLSLPNKLVIVKRYKKIIIKTLNLQGKNLYLKINGLTSICAQHEIDHLKGKLIIDYNEIN